MANNENNNENKELIKDEYLHLQKVIEDFDARTITIKAWSVSFSLVTLAAAFASSAPFVLVLGSLSAFLFWFTEAYWKEFQATYYRRIDKIEEFFAHPEQNKNIVPMQIRSSWRKAWKEDAGEAKADAEPPRWRPHWREGIFWRRGMLSTALPHVVVVLLGLFLFAWVKAQDHELVPNILPEKTPQEVKVTVED